MKRYDFGMDYGDAGMVAEADGEWLRYSDHVEEMKRIAGASPAALTRDDMKRIAWKADADTRRIGGSHYNAAMFALEEAQTLAASPSTNQGN